jgi:hypothetical protein
MLFVSRLLALVLIGLILFYPLKALFGWFQTTNVSSAIMNVWNSKEKTTLKLPSVQTADEINLVYSPYDFEEPTQKAIEDLNNKAIVEDDKKSFDLAALNPLKKIEKSPEPVQDDFEKRLTFFNYLTGTFPSMEEAGERQYSFIQKLVLQAALRDLMMAKDELAIHEQSTATVSDVGSPAEFVLATVNSPVYGITYELNTIEVSPYDGAIRVRWKLRNDTSSPMFINPTMRYEMRPTKLLVTDFIHQRSFPIKWNRQMPIANCMLTNYIPAKGRVECSALVRPLFESNDILRDTVVVVRLPGAQSVRVHLNV